MDQSLVDTGAQKALLEKGDLNTGLRLRTKEEDPFLLTMDKYINQIFSSSSWSDVDAKEIPSWACCESEQPNEALLGSVVAVDEHENNSSPTYLTNSNSLESLVAQDVSSILQDFAPDARDGGKNCEVQNIGMHYGVDGNMVRIPLCSIALENAGCDSFEPPLYQGFNGDFETLSPISQPWPLQAYEGVSPAPASGMGQRKMCSFGINGDYGDYVMPSDPNNLGVFVSTEKGMQDVQNYPLPSFASAPRMSGLQSLPQNTSTNPVGECNGNGKPRMRARRGQATDPHSIAERLRREKISDRMKNLQELVPKSNRTDKASMLDEIIEYVRFLQLQVKELSMSKVGAAGAVVPLTTDGQAKIRNGLPQLPSIGQAADVSFDEIALEQLVRLMESDADKALQHLQSKGFCLMPVALADAISAAKESSSSRPSAPLPDDWKKKETCFTDIGVVQNNSRSSSNSSSSPDQIKREVNNKLD